LVAVAHWVLSCWQETDKNEFAKDENGHATHAWSTRDRHLVQARVIPLVRTLNQERILWKVTSRLLYQADQNRRSSRQKVIQYTGRRLVLERGERRWSSRVKAGFQPQALTASCHKWK
jgi:hypothetical protein